MALCSSPIQIISKESAYLKSDCMEPNGYSSLTLGQVTLESPCRKEVRNSTKVVLYSSPI